MQATAIRPATRNTKEESRRYDRVERQYSSQRPLKELVLDLLRAHSDK